MVCICFRERIPPIRNAGRSHLESKLFYKSIFWA